MSWAVIVASVCAADVRRALRRRRRARARLQRLRSRPAPPVPVAVKEARSAVVHARQLVAKARQLALLSVGESWHRRNIADLADAERHLADCLATLREVDPGNEDLTDALRE